MKLEDVRSAYQYNTEKASEIVRQLGFAGIALIWLFRDEAAGRAVIPAALLPAGLFIIAALALDLLQYVTGSLIWGIYNRQQERADTCENREFTANRMLNWPTLLFFWGKVVFIGLAYLLLGIFVARTISKV